MAIRCKREIDKEMKKNIVAIVGRPNVGKSTLFNRICKKRSAIVDFEEGVTRDRKYEEAEWTGRNFIVVDTGGIIPKSDDRIDKAVKFQAEVAIDESDVILFLVDTKVGITKTDTMVARILSPVRDRVLLVANKTDSEKDDLNIYEFMKLGFGEPFPIAASSGRNIGNFLDVLVSKFRPESSEKEDDDSIKVAIVGKPNVGKSSIINKISGKDVTIVTDIPGTTRDSIDLNLIFHEQKMTFIDTAGLRKKKRIKYGVEYFSSMRTIESINRADIVLLILDATEDISTQDQKIISYAARNFKDMIIIFNKWDLVEKDNAVIGKYMNKIKDELPFVQYSPAMFVSALTGQRIQNILQKIIEVEEESQKRIPTAELNRFLERTVQKFPPSHSSGKHSKIYFCTQVKTHPPTFVYFCNDKKLITESYRRYIHNQMRETFKFEGATLRIFFRGKEK